MRSMKRLFIGCIIIVLAGSLTACGQKDSSKDNVSSINKDVGRETANDDKTITVLSDGTKKELIPDGTVIETSTDGSVTEIKPDGTVTVIMPDGSKIETLPNEATPDIQQGESAQIPEEETNQPKIETDAENPQSPTDSPVEEPEQPNPPNQEPEPEPDTGLTFGYYTNCSEGGTVNEHKMEYGKHMPYEYFKVSNVPLLYCIAYIDDALSYGVRPKFDTLLGFTETMQAFSDYCKRLGGNGTVGLALEDFGDYNGRRVCVVVSGIN